MLQNIITFFFCYKKKIGADSFARKKKLICVLLSPDIESFFLAFGDNDFL